MVEHTRPDAKDKPKEFSDSETKATSADEIPRELAPLLDELLQLAQAVDQHSAQHVSFEVSAVEECYMLLESRRHDLLKQLHGGGGVQDAALTRGQAPQQKSLAKIRGER